MQSFIMNSHEVFIHIHQSCFAGTGAIVRLPQCQWSKPDGYGKISQCITTTKHSKAKTVCIFLGIYCILSFCFMYPNVTCLWNEMQTLTDPNSYQAIKRLFQKLMILTYLHIFSFSPHMTLWIHHNCKYLVWVCIIRYDLYRQHCLWPHNTSYLFKMNK